MYSFSYRINTDVNYLYQFIIFETDINVITGKE